MGNYGLLPLLPLLFPSRNALPSASSKFRTKRPRTSLTRHRFPLRGAVNNLKGEVP